MRRSRPILPWLAPIVVVFAMAFPASVFASAPSADDKMPTTLEDIPVDITLSGSDAAGGNLTFAIVTPPSAGTLGSIAAPSCDGLTPSSCSAVVAYTPSTNMNGADTFTYVSNNGVDSPSATVSITISAVNDAPSFTKGADQTVAKDSGAASVPGWATSISPGPTDESGQTVTFAISAADTSLFSTQPAIASNGDLTFTPATGKYGTTTGTVSITDNGGTANGGADTSANQTFAISVHGPPTAHNDTATVAENANATAIDVLANDTYLPNAPEALVISVVGQGTNGTVAITGGGSGLTYKPNALFTGSDLFTYTISDPGGLTASASVLVNVVKDVTAPVVGFPTQAIRTGLSTTATGYTLRVSWTGADAGVGLSRFELQRQVDGGTWTAQALATPTTKSVDPFVTAGHVYHYRVRGIDRNGNVGPWRYGQYLNVSRYEETSSVITYGGTWTKSPLNASNSGGHTKYAFGFSKTASFKVTARDFAFVSPTSSVRGTVRIYVDGVLVSTISEKSSTTVYRRVLWATHFSTLASHTIKVYVFSSARVDVDAFLALR